MCPYASLWMLYGPYVSLLVPIRFYGFYGVLMRSYWSFFVLMDFNGFLWVHIGFLCVFMGPYRSLSSLMDSNVSLWVRISRYAFLLVLLSPNSY